MKQHAGLTIRWRRSAPRSSLSELTSCASMALGHWSMSCAITQDRLHRSQSFLQHYWFRARHMHYPRANCGSDPPQTRSKWRPNALAIDACDRTRVTTTRRPRSGLGFFTGTSRTSRGIGIAITRIGSGMTFLAIAEMGSDRRPLRDSPHKLGGSFAATSAGII